MYELHSITRLEHMLDVFLASNIGVGAGKFLGVRRNFARIFPNLPEKYSASEQVTSNKKLFMSIRAPLFLNQSMLGTIFAQIFREF